MDAASQAEFNRITSLKAEDLSPEDRAFLFARREYLNKAQVEEFADVIKLQQAAVADREQEVKDEAQPAKKGK